LLGLTLCCNKTIEQQLHLQWSLLQVCNNIIAVSKSWFKLTSFLNCHPNNKKASQTKD
jgi:hypothetical protein